MIQVTVHANSADELRSAFRDLASEPSTLSAEVLRVFAVLARTGTKIEAIKAVRSRFGFRLHEAKVVVEAVRGEG